MKDRLTTSPWKAWVRRRWWQLRLLQALVLFLGGALFAWSIMPAAPGPDGTDSDGGTQGLSSGRAKPDAAAGDQEPQWWTCAMHPQIRQQKPGKCPICSMELVPVQASAGGLRTLVMRPDVKKLLNIQTSPVERRYVKARVRMVGKMDYDETRLAHITAWVPGRLDRLFVDYTGVQVNPGDHMVYIYSEELYSIQEELIRAIRFQRESPRATGGLDLVEAAREKLRLLGLTDEQIREIEQRDQADDHVTIFSPAGGIVIEKLKQEGDRVQVGDRIYTVADLNHLWLKLDAYESDLVWIRYGQKVKFTTEAYPGETFFGRIAFIDPVLNKQTRTVKVRVNVDNRDGRLKPEMFVRAIVESEVAVEGRVVDPELAGKWIGPMHPEIVKDQPGVCDICGMPLVRAESLGYVSAEPDAQKKPLVIPVTAALITGTRAIVYVQVPGTDEPTFEGREVLLGPRAGDYYLVRNGLFEGEQVVTHGNFKIDSALQIQAKPTMMTPDGGGGGGGHNHGGSGKKKKTDSSNSGMQMDLPEAFVRQMHDLMAAADQVQLQLKTDDLALIRQAFQAFKKALDRVNAERLEGHPSMVWIEFLMRFQNDAIEGAQARDLETARRSANSLRHNMQQLSRQLMLGPGGHEMASSANEAGAELVVDDAFRIALNPLIEAYLGLRAALAHDDLDAGRNAFQALQTALDGVDDRTLQGAAKEMWQSEGESLRRVVEQMGQATDLESVRKQFALLSDQVLVVVRRFQPRLEYPLFELHCPMAFEGRGASWLQESDDVGNPYFGSAMLSCADRVDPIELNSDLPESTEEDGHE